MRNPAYDVLFEPVKIGPVTAPNRFYQTPHATGMGWRAPQASAALRGIKAEGGWGVVCTEYCSIHPSSDDFPFGYLSLWDEDDVRALAAIGDAIHRHGSLMGVELWHGGHHAGNKLTREPALSPSSQRLRLGGPGASRAMDLSDIRALIGWQREAAARARRAGADIVYVYAGHDYLPLQFLSPRSNRRTDAYGGGTANRTRLIRELIDATRDAVHGECAVAIRMAVDELHGPGGITHDGEARDILSILADIPDLWDVNVAGALGNDSRSARFSAEGYQRDYVAFVKTMTAKPVVGVGRFTSPDAMVAQIREGVLDLIGAARPSIADPFLPTKIREGRPEDIRECIGCNICRAANNEAVPLRCTQNPTMGEEWRRGWHPEAVPAARAKHGRVLVVGAGPAGLEAAMTLGRRGCDVLLAEAARELGGRLLFEAALPGLASWMRVRDHRIHMLGKLANVGIFRQSRLSVDDILGLGVEHVVLATGSRWRLDGIGTYKETPASISSDAAISSPEEVDMGDGPVLVYDDDHYAVASALAEKLKRAGRDVTYVTTAPLISSWTVMTDEQYLIEDRLVSLDIPIFVSHELTHATRNSATFRHGLSRTPVSLPFGTLAMVTAREPIDDLHAPLMASGHFASITRIGDCLAPSNIADAVFSGHRFAREFGEDTASRALRRERPMP